MVQVAQKFTTVKQPEEANQLLNEINSFLEPDQHKQDERISEIQTLASQIYGPDKTNYASVVTSNKEMVDSFNSISNELRQLSNNLVAAEEQKQRLIREQEELKKAEEARKLEDERRELVKTDVSHRSNISQLEDDYKTVKEQLKQVQNELITCKANYKQLK